ncbi:hypothetical protein L227DRAFT_306608 [Lentinus tigrinus ALCF2SS1-6]|uniref:Uncharacterized protein n=1 Tax=Lentinus tigrinus ALCF2SS1-6 TaxID=1328759 RepID=A0A5C2RVU3_9APHY|nr:hypothetical protein L227DRAFT_306608 [Lentinus tigrinus ALCF2SS1-6]
MQSSKTARRLAMRSFDRRTRARYSSAQGRLYVCAVCIRAKTRQTQYKAQATNNTTKPPASPRGSKARSSEAWEHTALRRAVPTRLRALYIRPVRTYIHPPIHPSNDPSIPVPYSIRAPSPRVPTRRSTRTRAACRHAASCPGLAPLRIPIPCTYACLDDTCSRQASPGVHSEGE